MAKKLFYINLKRFDVPVTKGGLCPDEQPDRWMKEVIRRCVEEGLDKRQDIKLTFFVPEILLIPACSAIAEYASGDSLSIGCQGIYHNDVCKGGNFGAMTGERPAAAMTGYGCGEAIIAHSELRREKLHIMSVYDSSIETELQAKLKAIEAVDRISADEAACALSQGMKIVYCIGETAEQKGSEVFDEYAPRVKEVIRKQIMALAPVKDRISAENVCLGYEPVWAIGPGKVPPDGEYISFVSDYVKQVCREFLGTELPVIYGGGLKTETAPAVAAVESIDGGLIALTKFVPPIGFTVTELCRIISAYMG